MKSERGVSQGIGIPLNITGGNKVNPSQWDDLSSQGFGNSIDTTTGRIGFDYDDLAVFFADNARYAATEQYSTAPQTFHRQKIGVPVYPHVHWLQNQNAEPNWLLEYRVYGNGQSPGAYTAVASEGMVFTYSSETIMQISTFGTIDMSSITGVSATIDLKLYRDAANDSTLFSGADPYTGNALLKFCDLHVQIDAAGSNSQFTKGGPYV
jgi:hypothetical protein